MSHQHPSQILDSEHRDLKQRLAHLSSLVGSLIGPPGTATSDHATRDLMRSIVDTIANHIIPHADWEENVFYPAVDRRASDSRHRFTESMRYEHKIVAKWLDRLRQESENPQLDAKEFNQQANRLLGLIEAHFEEEEQVLLPLLSQSVSHEEFESEIMNWDEQ